MIYRRNFYFQTTIALEEFTVISEFGNFAAKTLLIFVSSLGCNLFGSKYLYPVVNGFAVTRFIAPLITVFAILVERSNSRSDL